MAVRWHQRCKVKLYVYSQICMIWMHPYIFLSYVFS